MDKNHPGYIPTIKRIRKEPKTAAFRNVTIEEGSVKLDEAIKMCFAVGHMLQGIPKKTRQLTVARLCNVAEAHRKNSDSPLTYLAIEAIVAGWEDWPYLGGEGVPMTSSSEIDEINYRLIE